MTLNTGDPTLNTGDPVIMGVAPGWIFAGIIKNLSEEEIVLAPAVYIEGISDAWPVAALNPKLISKAAGIDTLAIRIRAILWHSPCAEGVARYGATSAIRRATK